MVAEFILEGLLGYRLTHYHTTYKYLGSRLRCPIFGLV